MPGKGDPALDAIELDRIETAPLTDDEESDSPSPATTSSASCTKDDAVDRKVSECVLKSIPPKFFNRWTYTILYGAINLTIVACIVYYQSITTTLERRFKMNTKQVGVINSVNDIVQIIFCLLLAYGASKSHRPRWMAMGLLSVAAYCFLMSLPEMIYGAGSDAHSLVHKYKTAGPQKENDVQDRASLCRDDSNMICEPEQDSMGVKVSLTLAHVMLGIGCSIVFTAGASYLDDNIHKSKSPIFYALTAAGQSMGYFMGYLLASYSLARFVIPEYTKIVNQRDPQYIGAWWMGWIILYIILGVLSLLISFFPKSLQRHNQQREEKNHDASLKDFLMTCGRLAKNHVHMFNHLSAVLYNFGYIGLWTYMPKYIEIMFSTTAASSNTLVGYVNTIFFTVGLIVSCLLVWYKVHARKLILICLVLGALTALGTFSHAFRECPSEGTHVDTMKESILIENCNTTCNCAYAKYSPVCAYGQSFISPCHAGCSKSETYPNGTKIFSDCKCIQNVNSLGNKLPPIAKPGDCPSSCEAVFYSLLALLAFQKFFEGVSRLPKFIISVRCVDPKDKSVSIGFGLMLLSLCVFVPAPIIYGMIFDYVCSFWGQTCTGTGNCWVYNRDSMRFYINALAGTCMFLGVFFDFTIWYYVKDLDIYDEEKPKDNYKMDEEEQPQPKEETQHNEEDKTNLGQRNEPDGDERGA